VATRAEVTENFTLEIT